MTALARAILLTRSPGPSLLRARAAPTGPTALTLEAAVALGLAPEAQANLVLGDLDRLAAMLTRLGGFGA